jgi:hypothetical protein
MTHPASPGITWTPLITASISASVKSLSEAAGFVRDFDVILTGMTVYSNSLVASLA